MGDRDVDEEDEIEVRQAPPRAPTEGVRIIGAEEAQVAIETGQAAGKRPDDELRFGDVPPPPEGPRPQVSFPLAEDSDPSTAVPKPPVVPTTRASTPGGNEPPPGPSGTDLPHWTEPPTGEVPRILPESEDRPPDDDADAWSSVSSPRWRDQPGDWEGRDFDDDELQGARDTRVGALADRPEHSDLYSFDEPEPEAEPLVTEPPPPVRASSRPRPQPFGDEHAGGGGRNVPVAVATALGLGGIVLLAAAAGPGALLVLAGAAVVLASAELFNGLRLAGYHPATALGLVGTISLIAAAYRNGEAAFPLVLAMFVVFGFLWYLIGVIRARPVPNLAVTLLAFVWVGFLGSFAALLLKFPHRHGVSYLVLAIVATVANDVAAFFVGSRFGRSPMAREISPHKTWEGFLGASVATIIVTVVVVAAFGLDPWTIRRAFLLSLVVIVFAPLGDLCESLVKRDLNLKDAGSILPGHGGVLDRLDALLFVVPATFYLVRLLELH
jgi:phosphatidate cytidylyltransferase